MTEHASAPPPEPVALARRRPQAANWVWPVAVLALCHAQAVASFQILNILVDPIRTSLRISDTQFSLLQGLAVAIFSAALGIPAARWADRHGRRNVILAGAIGWSLSTAACAFVTSFAQFFAARVIMGMGEVFLFPAALALIAGLVPRARLSMAIACFGVGGPLGGAAALFGGGWIVSHSAGALDAWRIAFFVCGLTGLISAALLLTIKEPRSIEDAEHPSFAGVLAYLRQRWRLFLLVGAGMICLSACAFASAAWVPTVFTRVYSTGSALAGELAAIASIAGGTIFVWVAGWLVDRLHAMDDRASPLTVSIGLCALLGLVVSGTVVSSGRAAILFWICTYALLAVPTVLGGTAFQIITPPRIRAQVMAIYLLLMNMFALSLGPFFVAFLVEHVFRQPNRVDQSLAIVDIVVVISACICFFAARDRFRRQAGQG